MTKTLQINYNDIQSWSNRGPSAMGENGVSIAANGAWGPGDLALNESLNGWRAWASWGGTSRSAPVAAGNMALIYDAFKTEERPLADQRRGARHHDGRRGSRLQRRLHPGRGHAERLRSVKIAGGLDGTYITPDNWTFGGFRGQDYDSFAKLMHPGQTSTKEFKVLQSGRCGQDVDDQRQPPGEDRRPRNGTSPPAAPTESAYSGNRPDYLWDVTSWIPAGTDLMEVKAVLPFAEFDPDGNYAANQTWRVAVYNWYDANGDGKLWTDKNSNGAVNCPLVRRQPDLVGSELRDPALRVHPLRLWL